MNTEGAGTNGFDFAVYENAVPYTGAGYDENLRMAPAPELYVVPAADVAEHEEDDTGPRYVDVAAMLDGTLPEPPKPVLLHRTDGRALFYANKVNMVFGDPETGKTLLVLAACAEALAGNRKVLIVDLDHNGKESIVGLLLMLGAPTDQLRDPQTFRLYDDIDNAMSIRVLVEQSKVWRPAVAVVDSIGELLPMMGANSNDNDDFTRAHNTVLKPLAAAGAAVIGIDHLAKNQASRALGPTGNAAKRRTVAGLSLRVEAQRQFIPGKGGTADLYVNKDRPGGVRRHCPVGGREQYAGRFVIEAADNTGAVGWRILPPLDAPVEASLDDKSAQYLRAAHALEEFTIAALAAKVSGQNPPAKSAVDDAAYHVDKLEGEHLDVVVKGRRGRGGSGRWRVKSKSETPFGALNLTINSENSENA